MSNSFEIIWSAQFALCSETCILYLIDHNILFYCPLMLVDWFSPCDLVIVRATIARLQNHSHQAPLFFVYVLV